MEGREIRYWRGIVRVWGEDGITSGGTSSQGAMGEREYGCPEGREGLEPWKEEASKAWERVGVGED